MSPKILYRPPLPTVTAISLLFLGVMGANTTWTSQLPDAAPRAHGGPLGQPRQPGRAEHADVREPVQHRPEGRPEDPLQLRQRLRHAPAQADPGHGPPLEPRQPLLRDADLVKPRPDAGLQRL